MKWFVSSPQKLIAFLQSMMAQQESGKALRRALESNLCRINGKIERFGSTQLRQGDEVELASSWKTPSSSALKFTTLYEDESMLLVDKPAGWICDDKHCSQSFGKDHFLVHRLDKDTTGVLALAKGPEIRDLLMEQFSKRVAVKKYLALADGLFRQKEGVRDTFLCRKKVYAGQTIWGSGSSGQQAITKWKVISEGNLASLVLCQPFTGRTHQIRVHLAELGHPILVDRQYAASYRSPLFAKRPLLHALSLELYLKDKKITAQAPIPQDMKDALSFCGCHTTRDLYSFH